ncbi:2-octaprenyl-6-methoxyphenyl hydroxylase [Arsukibacterium sp.]|uniref:2-octaprenyl-6-methoxyphenyl hydroxylase n=1 Tax=Arsukibacterium sp. TaxID=1977258 RepID=UPI002FDA4102
MKQQHFDLIIAGGGMAGAMLAYALRQQCPALQLAIIEQQRADTPAASFDSRSIALAASSVEQLAAWGLWPALASHACAIKHIEVSDKGHFGKTYLSADEYRKPALGQVLEVEHLGSVLQQALTKDTAVRFFQPNAIAQLQPELKQQQLLLADGQQLSAKLLVIAEGGQSPSRQLAGFTIEQQPYQQTAIISNLALATAHQHKAFERFTADGPIALLPLTGQRYSLVWTVQQHQAAELLSLSDSDFLARLLQQFGYSAGIFTRLGQRVAYPLQLRKASEVVRHRSALLGNSLHNLHPIAGQGFNLALRDISCLVQLLQHSTDAGAYPLLRQYQQQRQQDMQRVIWFTDALVRSFSNQSRLVALARNLGLTAMLLCDDLKRPLATQAMGYGSAYAKV